MQIEENLQSINSYRKFEKLQIQLIDIQQSLRFGHRGTTYIKQNYSKCLKVFYQLQEFFSKNRIDYLYKMLKKIFECIGLGFIKLFTSIQCLQKQNIKIDKTIQKTENIKKQTTSTINKRNNQLKKLGGVTVGQIEQRGLQQIVYQNHSIKGISLQPPVQLSQLRNSSPNQQTLLMNQVNAYLNKRVNPQRGQQQLSIQIQLMQILQYFNECEKQAIDFLNLKLWDANIDGQLPFKSLIQEFEKSIGFKKQMAQKKVNLLFTKNYEKIKFEREQFIQKQKQHLQKQKQKLKKLFTKQLSSQTTQTYEVSQKHILQQYIHEKTIQYENQKRKNQTLTIQLQQFKNTSQAEKNQTIKVQRAAQNYKNQIDILHKQIQPMKQYLKTLNKQYNQLFSKFKNIWQIDIQEVVKIYTQQYSTEMRMSLVNSLKKILDKLGISNQQAQYRKKNNIKFRFRVDKIKGLQDCFEEQFFDDLSNSQKKTIKRQSKITKQQIKQQKPLNESYKDASELSKSNIQEWRKKISQSGLKFSKKMTTIDQQFENNNLQIQQQQNYDFSNNIFENLEQSSIHSIDNQKFDRIQKSEKIQKFDNYTQTKMKYQNKHTRKQNNNLQKKQQPYNFKQNYNYKLNKEQVNHFKNKQSKPKHNNNIQKVLNSIAVNTILSKIQTYSVQIQTDHIFPQFTIPQSKPNIFTTPDLKQNVRLSLQNLRNNNQILSSSNIYNKKTKMIKKTITQSNQDYVDSLQKIQKNIYTPYIQYNGKEELNDGLKIKNLKNLNNFNKSSRQECIVLKSNQKFNTEQVKMIDIKGNPKSNTEVKYLKTTFQKYYNQKQKRKSKELVTTNQNFNKKIQKQALLRKSKQIQLLVNEIEPQNNNLLIQQLQQLLKVSRINYNLSPLVKKFQISGILEQLQLQHLQLCKTANCIHLDRFIKSLKKMQLLQAKKNRPMRVRLQMINKIQTQNS